MINYDIRDYIWTTEDVARVYKYNKQYLRTLAKSGILPSRKRNRMWMFCPEELEAHFGHNGDGRVEVKQIPKLDELSSFVHITDTLKNERSEKIKKAEQEYEDELDTFFVNCMIKVEQETDSVNGANDGSREEQDADCSISDFL